MKNFMQPRNTILRETTQHDLPPQSPNPNSSAKSKSSRKHKGSKENAPPSDLNSMFPLPPSAQKASPAAKLKSPLPPRPPNPLKRKLIMEAVPDNSVPGSFDSGVKVIVRMRPPNKDEEGEMIVQKISNDSLTINGQTFTFDSVADTESTQLDIYQLVGAPLVENCLAGFNSSVFAYGQTGSGKTYTMWGPANSLLAENFSSDQQGLTPRVFEQLFARINEEQTKHADKQLEYQCRCSFLEIYNEQITDLLDANQKNLQIREDVKSGVYVEDLTEECVFTTKDVIQLLIKGLSNRRTGATSINAESSRSHSVFTCVLESQCKSTADGVSSFKTSRINLVDLAGSERQKLTGAAGERLKEAGNINRSLSQLGNLINILAEVSQTGKQRHIPYRDSRLTFLLQESLGGNAKLAMVCAISPDQSCRSETFSTLRFAQRAKAIKNKATVNEVTQEDVNTLREVIRQLKDELLRMKANGNNPADLNAGFARRSLNLLKLSLNRPIMLPHVQHDSDEEMEIDEEAVENASVPMGVQSPGSVHNKIVVSKVEPAKSDLNLVACRDGCFSYPQPNSTSHGCIKEQNSDDTDVDMEEEISKHDKNEIMIVNHGEPVIDTPNSNTLEQNDIENSVLAVLSTLDEEPSDQPTEEKKILSSSISKFQNDDLICTMVGNGSTCPVSEPLNADIVVPDATNNFLNGLGDGVSPSSLSIVSCDPSHVSKSPTLSVSPRISNNSRKSLRTSSMLTASQKDLKDDSKSGSEAVCSSFSKSIKCINPNVLSTKTSKNFLAPTEHLAASLHRGLEIMEGHRQSSPLRQSLFRFSLKPADSKLILPVDKVDVGVQTYPQDIEMLQEDPTVVLCDGCKGRTHLEGKESNDCSNLQLIPVHGSESAEKLKKQVPKAVEKVLAGSFRREMALEEFCAKQNAEIVQLNRLVQQYKHERECNAILGQTREDKILRLESLMDGVLPTEDFMEEELVSLTNEYKLLTEKYENHPEVLRTNIELKRVQDELEGYRNFFDMGEREVLLEEIQDLRSQLQYYTDFSSLPSRKRSSLLKLTGSCEPKVAPPLSTIPESTAESAEQKLEQEKIRWTEAESNWISLTEELRSDLEASRSLAEKQKRELDTEKRCAEELKEAMQMAMQGHARMLEQYADLEEKHIHLLARHRRIQDGIDDVKKAAAKARGKGAESKFINALAAEISALKVEREKERHYLRDEIKGLQGQLRDTAEAVQAAGELLVRLKEAEEAVTAAQKRAMEAEQETQNAYKKIDKLKRRYENEISTLNQYLAESRLPKEALRPACNDSLVTKYDSEEPNGADDQQWREEFQEFYNSENGELAKLAEPSWFSGYDRCNI